MNDQRSPINVENPQDASDFFVADDAGFDFEDILLAMKRVNEEFRELDETFNSLENDFQHFAEELGDCFFALVNVCRHAGLDPEELLKSNTNKYLDRCFQVENQLRIAGQSWKSNSLQEIDEMWWIAKLSAPQVSDPKVGIAGETRADH